MSSSCFDLCNGVGYGGIEQRSTPVAVTGAITRTRASRWYCAPVCQPRIGVQFGNFGTLGLQMRHRNQGAADRIETACGAVAVSWQQPHDVRAANQVAPIPGSAAARRRYCRYSLQTRYHPVRTTWPDRISHQWCRRQSAMSLCMPDDGVCISAKSAVADR